MKLSDKFLKNDELSPKVDYNHDLDFLGTETSFGFGAEVAALEATKKFPQIYKFHIGDTGPKTPEPIIDSDKIKSIDRVVKSAEKEFSTL